MYALAVMGRDNSNIAPFMEHTKCKLTSTVKGDWFPGTEEHVVTIQAFTDEALHQGVQMVVQTLQEVPPQGQNGEYRLRVIVPQKVAGCIIGKSGENLKRMQQATGMKVAVDQKTYCGVGPEADQVVTLSGQLAGMQAAVTTTLEHMKQLRSSPWFMAWMGRQNAERIAEVNLSGGSMAGSMMGGNMGGCQGNMGMPNMMAMGNMGGMPMAGMDGMGGMANMGMGMGNMGMGNMGMMGGMNIDATGAMGVGNGMGGANGSLGESSIDILHSALQMIPPHVAEDARGFSLRCAVPNRLANGLLGKGGSIAKEVRDMTGARIDIPNNPNDAESRAMSITGPLFSTVAAYIYMMKQYLEIEAAGAQQGGDSPMGMGMGMGMTNAPLCAQALGQMEQQLTMQLQQVKQMREQLAVIEAGGVQQ